MEEIIMYEITCYKDKYDVYELKDKNTNSWLKVCPERGGIIIGYGVNGKEMLYMDMDTFYDEKANIRGGIPILFPICGQLINGSYELDGTSYSIRNHGVARISKWVVVDQKDREEASITIKLESNEETRKMYPFDFQLMFTYILKYGKLQILQQYKNKSNEEMPMYAGFHPYFYTKNKNICYITDATKYYDLNDNIMKDYNGALDISHMKESAVFMDAKKKSISFQVEDLKSNINIQYGEEFKYVVLWTVENNDFVCVEPWMAMTNSFNTKQDIYYIKPGKELNTYLNIEVSNY
jgi:galactose mutarotase-like enzyme